MRITTRHMTELTKGNCNINEILSDEDLKDIADAKEDIKAGRVHTTVQVRKNLGL